jgi:hypothetical protein
MVRFIGKKFTEKPFQDEVHDMAEFVKKNPEIFGEDAKIISQELKHGPDDRRVDFLVYYPNDALVGIVELKNVIATEKVLLQTLRYADWLRKNPDTLKYAVSRSNQIDPEKLDLSSLKIVIIAPKISTLTVELSQYICDDFDFEFIQLQRFVDDCGEFAVIEPVEAEVRKIGPSTQKLVYSDEAYAERGIDKSKLDVLSQARDELLVICEQESFKLTTRFFKNAIKFQTPGGRNVFFISIRKEKDHYLRMMLGEKYQNQNSKVSESVKKELKQKNQNSRVWSVPLSMFSLTELVPLLHDAYEEVVGE